MTWTLIIHLTFAITGYPTEADCKRAAYGARGYHTQCIETHAGGIVTGTGR